MILEPASYPRHRFPAEIISHAVWLYHVFSLSLRDVLASPGVVEIQRAAWVWRTGVGGGGHRTDRLGWSCDTSTEAERGSDDRREIGAVRAIGEGW